MKTNEKSITEVVDQNETKPIKRTVLNSHLEILDFLYKYFHKNYKSYQTLIYTHLKKYLIQVALNLLLQMKNSFKLL